MRGVMVKVVVDELVRVFHLAVLAYGRKEDL
jgi:hypothetical protein